MRHASRGKGPWLRKIGAARSTWQRLSEDELLQSAGHAQILVHMLQQHYAISRLAAEKQVISFFDSLHA